MPSKWRQFEVLLPLRLNSGEEIPEAWIAQAVYEVVDHFDAASYELQRIEGHWRGGGTLYRDELVKIVVDLPDTPANRQWMRQFKSRWRERLQQLELSGSEFSN